MSSWTRHARLTARLEVLQAGLSAAAAQCAPRHGAADRRPGCRQGDKQFCAEVEKLGASSAVVTSSRWCRPSFSLPCPDPVAAYRRLKQTNPSPLHVLRAGRGASPCWRLPESAVKFCANSRQVEMPHRRHPAAVASTRTAASAWIWTAASGWSCARTRKRWPNTLMLVDLGRNDIARISAPAPATSGICSRWIATATSYTWSPGGGHPSRRP